ncbi:hypothetical protein, partial [Pandoraea apista]|uniref:hypothetical protein n=1 Tax=Pandoraea apista TaxID=93218 RepID=UPI001C636BBD
MHQSVTDRRKAFPEVAHFRFVVCEYQVALKRLCRNALADLMVFVEHLAVDLWSCPCNSGHVDTVRLMTP